MSSFDASSSQLHVELSVHMEMFFCVNFYFLIESKETVNHHTPPKVIMEICEYRNVSFDMSFCHH